MFKTLVLLISLLTHICFAQNVSVLSEKLGDSDHFEFSGEKSWDYEFNRSGVNTYELLIPSISDKAKVQLESFKSKYISNISVSNQGLDKKVSIKFQLTNQGVESFDYQTEQPSRLIVDFYANEAKTQKTAQVAEGSESKIGTEASKISTTAEKDGLKTAAQKNTSTANGSDLRKPASDVFNLKKEDGLVLAKAPEPKELKKVGIFDGGDPNFERFSIKDYEIKEEAIIKSKENVYIQFPMLENELTHLNALQTQQPVYEISPKADRENKEARLLLTLYEKKRYAVYLKTLDWFKEKYPKSEYNEIIAFMTADIYYSLWKESQDLNDFEVAVSKYKEALATFPESKLKDRTLLLIGFATLDRNDALGAIREFQNYIKENPNSKNREISELAIANAYAKLRKYDEALLNYELLEQKGKNEANRVEASYLRGDIYIQKKDYLAAIKEYQQSIKKYPQSWSLYPNAFYNQAEALFWLGKYKESLNSYQDFLKKFPTHNHAGFAMTRLGELLEILGADKQKVEGAYLETLFRYGENPTSFVSQVRLNIGRMGTMKAKESEEVIKNIVEKSKLSKIAKIDEFTTIMVAEGLSHRKQYERSIKMLEKYYQENPTTADTKTLNNRIVKYINEQIYDHTQNKNFIEVFNTHKKYATTWLKNSDRVDTRYYLGQAFEQAGVATQADEYYRKVLNSVLSFQGSTKGKERNIFEKIPSLDELYLRLGSVSSLTKKYNASYDYLKQIKKPEALTEEQQIERVELAVLALEQKGDYNTSELYLHDLLAEWRGESSKVSPLYYKLAELEIKQNKTDEAITSLNKIDELMKDANKINEDLHAKTLEKLAELYLQKGQLQQATETYAKLLQLYEEKKPLHSIRYKLGEIYYQRGELKSAADTWNNFKTQENNFWYSLAQEKLKNSQWETEYKKYINRMPAAVSKEIKK